jgi:hypothetical protein
MYIGMKSENQNVVAGKSSRQHLMFVHISARSNLIAESLTNANLASSSYPWTRGHPIVVGEPHETVSERRWRDPLIYSQWACGRKSLPDEGLIESSDDKNLFCDLLQNGGWKRLTEIGAIRS